ncbi:MAG TPA: protein-export chaperone SecB [Steroidobacteraceae bacterium]|jgi:preprotein translocase subunit SecB|nr:protein-export chaperone SecB [Steroidobacteraceae bacterium]
MADENTPASNSVDPGALDTAAPQFAPQVIYLKDVSFESPMALRLPPDAPAPSVTMNINTSASPLSPELFEVVLTLNVQANVQDKPVWLCEVKQAGAFAFRNIPDAELRRILGVFCPSYLLPFARQTISDLLTKGGFPPFLVPPVNFDGLFDQAMQQAAAEQAQQAANSGNAPAPGSLN